MAREASMKTIAGNVVRKPEYRVLDDGRSVAKFSIAENKRQRDEQGNWTDGETKFWDVTVWDQQAENVANNLERGRRVVLAGRWEADRIYDRKDGSKGVKDNEITAYEIGPSLKFNDVKREFAEQVMREATQAVETGLGGTSIA